MRKRSLLVIATVAWVAPLSAQRHAPTWLHPNKADCPAARAKAEAAARQAELPGEGSIFGIGRSAVLMP